MTNSSGTVAWRAAYHAFGYGEVDGSSTVTNNLRLPGQYFDAETNLHYNWNRYYDPRTGRYLTPDPIGLEGGIDPFVYVENDPVNKTDISGLFPGPCGNEDNQWVPDRPFWVIDFSKACQAHDDCYGCSGEMERKTKTACDIRFWLDMRKICYRYIAIPGLFQACNMAANIYGVAVYSGGGTALGKARQSCRCR